MDTDEIRKAAAEADRRSEEYIELVHACFPEIKCLRCGEDDFLILPNVSGPSDLGSVTLACNRCGYLEQHLLSRLRKAVKDNAGPFPDRTEP